MTLEVLSSFLSAFSVIQGGSVLGLLLTSRGVLALRVLVELYKFLMTLEEFVAGYVWGCSSISLFCRVRGGISTKVAAVGAALSVLFEYRPEEDDERIPTSIADIVGNTVGDIAGMKAVFFGSFAEVTCAALFLIAFSDALENSWKLGGIPCSCSLWN